MDVIYSYDKLLEMDNEEEGEVLETRDDIKSESGNILENLDKNDDNKCFNKNEFIKKKRKRKNKSKSKKKEFNNNKSKNSPKLKSVCQIKNFYDDNISGSLLVKELDIDDKIEKNTSEINSKIFIIAKIKEINFDTDTSLFLKGRKENPNISIEEQDFPNLNFWHQRYYFFSKFDDGIGLDYESWYSVTPEEISIHIADSCKNLRVVDAFCGCGGNTIQFSLKAKEVYSIDIDPLKVNLCKNNSRIYNCRENITFVNSDFLKTKEIFPDLQTDCVFLSPPWGGMDYKSDESYSLKKWVTPDISDIIKISLEISPNLIFYLPRNTNIEELFSIIGKVIVDKIDNKNYTNVKNSEDDYLTNFMEDPTLFAEVHILNSASKVKALLIYFGERYNQMPIKDLRTYLSTIYPKIETYQLNQFINLVKILGASKFLRNEYYIRKTLLDEKNLRISSVIKRLKEDILTMEEFIEFNQLEQKAKKENKSEKQSKCNQPIPCIEFKLGSIDDTLSEADWNILKSKKI